jgi:hypothetical protein
MSLIYRIIFICFISLPLFFISLSCGNSSSSSSSSDYIIDPTDMTAPSTVTTISNSFTIGTRSSGTRKYGVITQNGTQTGISLASYNSNGTEVSKIVFYVDQGSSNGYALPTSSSSDVSFSSSGTGSYIAKYDDDGDDTTPLAMTRAIGSATISFTVHYVSSGIFSLTAVSVPSLSISAPVASLVQY